MDVAGRAIARVQSGAGCRSLSLNGDKNCRRCTDSALDGRVVLAIILNALDTQSRLSQGRASHGRASGTAGFITTFCHRAQSMVCRSGCGAGIRIALYPERNNMDADHRARGD